MSDVIENLMSGEISLLEADLAPLFANPRSYRFKHLAGDEFQMIELEGGEIRSESGPYTIPNPLPSEAREICNLPADAQVTFEY